MRKKRIGAATSMAILFLLLASSMISATEEIFPPSGFEGWKLDGKARTYAGEALYNHIDGGAEPFLELGFESCEVRRYLKAGMEITVESYRMSDSAAALGIYLMQCGKETPDPGFGERHTASSNQLTMVRSQALVRLTGKPGACPSRDVFLAFARYATDHIPWEPPPALFDLPPKDGQTGASVRILRGPVTLQPFDPPFSPESLSLGDGATGIAADYTGGSKGPYTLLLAEFPSVARAERALGTIEKSIQSGGGTSSPRDGGFLFTDASGRGGRASVDGSLLAIAWGFAPEASPR
jgi:hypothetical protein